MMHSLESVQFRATEQEGSAAFKHTSLSHCTMRVVELYYDVPGHAGPHLGIYCTSCVENLLSLSRWLFEVISKTLHNHHGQTEFFFFLADGSYYIVSGPVKTSRPHLGSDMEERNCT